MTEEDIVDLLIQRATVGLDEDQHPLLERTNAGYVPSNDISFDLAAAAVGIVDLDMDEPMPDHLRARIMASADQFFASPISSGTEQAPAKDLRPEEQEEYQKQFYVEPRRSWNWLSWAVAAAACIALGINIWLTRLTPPETVVISTPPQAPEKLTPEQELAGFMASQRDMTKAAWTAGNMKDLKDVGGDVMWSDENQKGFMRLRGLPVNDKSKETYQLWIFDKTQDKATPIDGGTFDVNSAGEVIIPINAKLHAEGTQMFAITIEKPGGVVVSKREKIAAIAKVETSS